MQLRVKTELISAVRSREVIVGGAGREKHKEIVNSDERNVMLLLFGCRYEATLLNTNT